MSNGRNERLRRRAPGGLAIGLVLSALLAFEAAALPPRIDYPVRSKADCQAKALVNYNNDIVYCQSLGPYGVSGCMNEAVAAYTMALNDCERMAASAVKSLNSTGAARLRTRP